MKLLKRYIIKLSQRKKAMQAAVGLWKDREDIGDSTAYVRKLRRGTRLQRVRGA